MCAEPLQLSCASCLVSPRPELLFDLFKLEMLFLLTAVGVSPANSVAYSKWKAGE